MAEGVVWEEDSEAVRGEGFGFRGEWSGLKDWGLGVACALEVGIVSACWSTESTPNSKF